MRLYEHAHLLSNIEKLPLPILGSMFPFWNPTGVFPRSVHPHVEKDILSLFLASSQFNVLRASTRVRRPPGPTWPGSTRAEAAQQLSRSPLRPRTVTQGRCDSDRSRVIGVRVGEFSACLSGAWSVMGHLQFKWQGQWPLALALAYWAARILTVVLGLGP